MVSTEENNIKCLMIGAKGIGKTTFLVKFPNSKLLSPASTGESYRINCLNEAKTKKSKAHFDYLDIDIDNCDIVPDTMFINQTELVESNEKLVNIFRYKVIILCFALNDPMSYDMVQIKWKLYLRKYMNMNKYFILLGLKSDTIRQFDTLSKAALLATVPERRSSSVSSQTSTSKLHIKNMRTNSFTDNETPSYQFLFKCDYKRFGRKVSGGLAVIQATSLEHSSDLFNATKTAIESYTSLARYICHYSVIKPKEPKAKYKMPSVLTTTLNYISHRSRKDSPKETPPPSQANHHSIVYEKQEEKLTLNANNLKIAENFSIRKKFSQLMLGFGNYVVTCGTGKSHQLQLKNKNVTDQLKPKCNLPKKDKSWLLLSSEVSLNHIDNDDVFLR